MHIYAYIVLPQDLCLCSTVTFLSTKTEHTFLCITNFYLLNMPSKNIVPKKDKICYSGCLAANPANQPEQGVKCPRCDSTNTKFCYYNNHSLTQPRYFCKGCRRYWTKGGALRTIPFGGGYRRKKISKSFNNKIATEIDYSTVNGPELFPGFDMDYPLATPTSVLSNSSIGSQDLNFTLSSIESMSSINQDLYWKSQQQRLAMLFGEQNYNYTNKKDTIFTSQFPLQNDLTQKSYDDVAYYCSSSKEGSNGNLPTEWLFESFYGNVEPIAVNDCGNNRGIIEGANSWINGMQGWSDFNLIMP